MILPAPDFHPFLRCWIFFLKKGSMVFQGKGMFYA
nr:MAG TPA: RNAseH-like protein [Caudoviricetes sp.]DAT67820.1 MAG TPA: RNAseH-like protein [Caudoviricetes sp.]